MNTQDLIGAYPMIVGEYRGFNNDRRIRHNDKLDMAEEKGLITHMIETNCNGVHLTLVKEYKETYDKDYKSPYIHGKTYLWPLAMFSMGIAIRSAFLARDTVVKEFIG
jgi:hypothetical protein